MVARVADSEVFGWSRIPNNTGRRSRIFCPTLEVQWIIFYITLLNWEFLLKWYNFFWTFFRSICFFAVHHDFHLFSAKFHILNVKKSESGVGNFGKVGAGNFGKSDSESPVGVGNFGRVGVGVGYLVIPSFFVLRPYLGCRPQVLGLEHLNEENCSYFWACICKINLLQKQFHLHQGYILPIQGQQPTFVSTCTYAKCVKRPVYRRVWPTLHICSAAIWNSCHLACCSFAIFTVFIIFPTPLLTNTFLMRSNSFLNNCS